MKSLDLGKFVCINPNQTSALLKANGIEKYFVELKMQWGVTRPQDLYNCHFTDPMLESFVSGLRSIVKFETSHDNNTFFCLW